MSEFTILIIEDDEVAAEILQKYIQIYRPEANLEWCWDGLEALIKLRDLKPDLILVDYMMPKIDGLEFLTTLKQLNAASQSYITVISAYVDKLKEKDFLAMGADEVMPKPIFAEQVESLLNRVSKPPRSKKKKSS